MNRTQAVQDQPFDSEAWQKLYYRHQQQYIRHRLEAINLLHQGLSRTEVCEQVGCSYDTLTSWVDKYLLGGLSELVRPIRHQKPSRLSLEQQQQLKAMVLTQRPSDYGIERQMWTGAILSKVIAQRFEVQLKDSRIYELLEELGLSYQRADRDYANADRAAQKDWVEAVKKNGNLSNPVSAPCFSMSLPFTIVRVYSMVGQNAILVQKSKVMNALATSSTDCYVLMR